ncbi:hypothetical protein Tco_0829238 [Tanacetum coccineum]
MVKNIATKCNCFVIQESGHHKQEMLEQARPEFVEENQLWLYGIVEGGVRICIVENQELSVAKETIIHLSVLYRILVFLFPLSSKAVAWPAEGTFMLVALDALSTMVETVLVQYLRDDRLEIVVSDDSSFVRSVGKKLAKLCEAKSLDSLGFKEVTKFVTLVKVLEYEGMVSLRQLLASALSLLSPRISSAD